MGKQAQVSCRQGKHSSLGVLVLKPVSAIRCVALSAHSVSQFPTWIVLREWSEDRKQTGPVHGAQGQQHVHLPLWVCPDCRRTLAKEERHSGLDQPAILLFRMTLLEHRFTHPGVYT